MPGRLHCGWSGQCGGEQPWVQWVLAVSVPLQLCTGWNIGPMPPRLLFACFVTVQALQSLMFLPPGIRFLRVPELLYWMVRAHLSQLSRVPRCELPACGELWAALLPPGTALVESPLGLMEDFPRESVRALALHLWRCPVVEEEGESVNWYLQHDLFGWWEASAAGLSV